MKCTKEIENFFMRIYPFLQNEYFNIFFALNSVFEWQTQEKERSNLYRSFARSLNNKERKQNINIYFVSVCLHRICAWHLFIWTVTRRKKSYCCCLHWKCYSCQGFLREKITDKNDFVERDFEKWFWSTCF